LTKTWLKRIIIKEKGGRGKRNQHNNKIYARPTTRACNKIITA
jgi:hypothetical protein